ncbi:MaoC family dehydratase [Salinibacterium sp. GXW1014]|uniref:MaoC family dehydratase n=1 Tax=Salinibacterium sp. GXW1014 TaxID=3377838 RepID=UPI00383B9E64
MTAKPCTASVDRMTQRRFGSWFEDLPVGAVTHHAIKRTLTESDNVQFSTMTMNPQPLHLDAEFAAKTEFGQPLVNSLLTLSTVVGLSVPELTLGTTVANLGFGSIEFPAPVFAGDTIRAVTEVTKARESKSRPDAGIVEFRHDGFNQRGELVCRAFRSALMLRRPAE